VWESFFPGPTAPTVARGAPPWREALALIPPSKPRPISENGFRRAELRLRVYGYGCG
jgi:hypothetical protein